MGAEETEATARIAKQPLPIVVGMKQVMTKSKGPLEVPADLLEQQTEMLQAREIRLSEGQRRIPYSGGLQKAIS